MEQVLMVPSAISEVETQVSQPNQNLDELLETLGITEVQKYSKELKKITLKHRVVFLVFFIFSLASWGAYYRFGLERNAIFAYVVSVISLVILCIEHGGVSKKKLTESRLVLALSNSEKHEKIIRYCHELVGKEQDKMIGIESDFNKTKLNLKNAIEKEKKQLAQIEELISNPDPDYDLSYLKLRQAGLIVAKAQKQSVLEELAGIRQRIVDYFIQVVILVTNLDRRLAYRLIIEDTEATIEKTARLVREADEAVNKLAAMFWEHTKNMQYIFDRLQVQTQQNIYQVQSPDRIPRLDTDLALKPNEAVALETFIEKCISNCQTA